MQYHGWQWKRNPVRTFKFMTSATVLTSPTLVGLGFYVIVLPGKLMPRCALWVSYGYSGNLHFCISWLLCVQRDKLSKMAHRKAHQTGWCCIIPCAWEWEWGTCKAGASLSLLLGPQITEAEGDGQGRVGMMWPQVDTQSRWQVWGNEKEREHALMVAVTTAITDWALIPCQELF